MRACMVGMLLLGAAISSAAQETTGDIRGRLQSPDGSPVIGATIVAAGPNMLGTRRATSASDGVFHLIGLPPGPLTLRASRIGFATLVIDSVRVRQGKTEGLGDIELMASTAQLSEVRVAARSVTLDPARTTIGA